VPPPPEGSEALAPPDDGSDALDPPDEGSDSLDPLDDEPKSLEPPDDGSSSLDPLDDEPVSLDAPADEPASLELPADEPESLGARGYSPPSIASTGDTAAVATPVPGPSRTTPTPHAIATPPTNRFVLKVRLPANPSRANATNGTHRTPAIDESLPTALDFEGTPEYLGRSCVERMEVTPATVGDAGAAPASLTLT